jgi:copper transport protein
MAAGMILRRVPSALTIPIGVAIGILLTASPAWGHAALVSSDPEPGAELSTSPGVVTLAFSEPLNVKLSNATVASPDGDTFEGTASPENRIAIPFTTNAPGVYEVEWTTVSTLDGHPLHGSFAFGVGVSPGAAGEGSVATGPNEGGLLLGLVRAVEYASLFAAMGMLLLQRLARKEPSIEWVRPRIRVALVTALVSGTTVVMAEAALAAGSPSLGRIATYLTTGSPGSARVLRVAAEAAAVAASFIGGGLIVVPLVVALVALAWSGHAAAVDPRWLGIGADAVHVLSAGLWAGGILALVTLRPPDGWREPQGRALLERFTPVALVAFSVTVAAGAVRGFQELNALSDLIRTSYGLVLLFKILAVVVMAQLSWLAWRRIVGSFKAEAVVAILVVGLAGVLAAFPLPPSRIAEAEAASEAAEGVSALPRTGDLTFGGNVGAILVGLTLRPGEPGRNEILVYMLPLDGEQAAAGISAELSVDGGSMESMKDCGPTCRGTELVLSGGEKLSVTIGGSSGGTAVFRTPALPASSGRGLLLRTQARIHALDSYRLREELSSGGSPIRSDYAFVAPDLARIDVEDRSTTVFVGGTRYLREGEGPWQIQRNAPPLSVPIFIWDSFRPWVDPRIVGSERVDGQPARVLSFFGSSGGTPAWFRLWIAGDGLVLQAQMRAQGHFMDQRYGGFDAPIQIQAPPGAA